MTQVFYSSSKIISQNIHFLYAFSAIILFIISYNLSRINLVYEKTVYANCVFGLGKNIVTNGEINRSFKGFKILRLLLRH